MEVSINEHILRLLLQIEWQGDERFFVCPSCRMSQQHGHKADCDLARRIREAQS